MVNSLMSVEVSVVVPTYNRADLLPATIESILAQDLPARDIIIVDDGSTDLTAVVMRERFPDLRLITIANSGDLVARNVGLREARGDLVAFCDSDDLWRPDHLSSMAALWSAEPGLMAAFANFRLMGEGYPHHPEKFDEAPSGWFDGLRSVGDGLGVFDEPIADRLVRFTPVFPSAIAVARRDFMGQGGWDETIGRGNDFATSLRIAMRPPIGVVLSPTVFIRKHPGNFSADIQKMNLGDALILEHVLARCPDLRSIEPQILRSIRTRRLDALGTAFARGDFAGVADIHRLLVGSPLPAAARVKCMVARLPAPLNRLLARGFLAAGSARSRLLGR
jgi:glycosyltransferase involved in cell wall biosynthesis